ncbi:MAG: SLC13 family permease [Kiritimatiellia bacterium]
MIVLRFFNFVRHNVVATVSVTIAALSFLFADGSGCWEAIDWRTLNLLFCLMFVVAGIRSCGFFTWFASKLLVGRKNFRSLALTLTLLTFFVAMLVTNDVALIALVAFAIYLLDALGLRHRIPGMIVLQTIAANLGSMATPIGNPQNLFLYTAYAIPTAQFFATMIPVTLGGLLILTFGILTVRDEPITVKLSKQQTLSHPRKILLYSSLFIFCLLSVFRLFPGFWLFIIVILCAVLFCHRVLLRVDYALLLTFVCFFIFANNVEQITALRETVTRLLTDHTLMTALLSSQIISNVPAALLLQPFTENWRDLLLGCDLGGLGTPIASLASLISLNLYLRESDAKPLRYLLLFTFANLVILLPLLLLLWVLR